MDREITDTTPQENISIYKLIHKANHITKLATKKSSREKWKTWIRRFRKRERNSTEFSFYNDSKIT